MVISPCQHSCPAGVDVPNYVAAADEANWTNLLPSGRSSAMPRTGAGNMKATGVNPFPLPVERGLQPWEQGRPVLPAPIFLHGWVTAQPFSRPSRWAEACWG
jgi:hypothetical protein